MHIVGGAIRVEKIVNPTIDEIDNLHARYVEKLKELFEDNKEKYGVKKQTMLNIL